MLNEIGLNPEAKAPMSFREKSAWAGLLTTALVYVPYFVYILQLFRRGGLSLGASSSAFLMAVLPQTALMIIIHAVFAARDKPQAKDERDFVIEHRAYLWSYRTLSVSVWLTIGAVVFLAGHRAADAAAYRQMILMMTQAVLLAFVLAESTRFLAQVIGYRQGR